MDHQAFSHEEPGRPPHLIGRIGQIGRIGRIGRGGRPAELRERFHLGAGRKQLSPLAPRKAWRIRHWPPLKRGSAAGSPILSRLGRFFPKGRVGRADRPHAVAGRGLHRRMVVHYAERVNGMHQFEKILDFPSVVRALRLSRFLAPRLVSMLQGGHDEG